MRSRGILRPDLKKLLPRLLLGGGLLCLAWLLWGPRLEAAPTGPLVLKFGCVAPEGSMWVSLTREWDKELRARSQNRARIQIFAGGILGEEVDIIRKMRAGQVLFTGVTGVGMGELNPSARILELPRLFRSYAELDAVTQRLQTFFADSFKARGWIMLGFTDVGPIHLLTAQPVRAFSDLNRLKMWVWESDPISLELAKAYGVSAVPLTLLNVLPSLQTKVINGVYGSPLSTVTMQWNNYLRYQTAEPLSFAMGVMAAERKGFEALPPDIQALQLELGRKYTRQMVQRARADNQRALELMKAKGLTPVPMSPEESARFDEKARNVWAAMQGKLYAPELLTRVQAILAETRAAAPRK